MGQIKHLDLFSGIGGFSLAADQIWDCEHVFCEIDPFCQSVIKKHWPHATIYGDIRELPQQENIYLCTASPPCQPASSAGRKRGKSDGRWLWQETIDILGKTKPRWIVLENVRGLLALENGLAFDNICSQVEALGYEIQPLIIPASAIGAPHRRDRVWILCHANDHGCDGTKDRQGGLAGSYGDPQGEKEIRQPTGSNVARDIPEPKWGESPYFAASFFHGMDDGIPYRTHRIRSLGNAIVPAVAVEIFKAIKYASNS